MAVQSLIDHFAPDCIWRLERAAELRFHDAEALNVEHRLAAIYLYGYCIEMCLAAAFFRAAGFHPGMPIDRDARQRRMSLARVTVDSDGEPIMGSDPHPLTGWARLLRWHRSASPDIAPDDIEQLNRAVKLSERAYLHWRPEMRYKTIAPSPSQFQDVRFAAQWLLQQRESL